jgi:hypothetical protein
MLKVTEDIRLSMENAQVMGLQNAQNYSVGAGILVG